MQQNQEEEDVWVRREKVEGDSKSNKSAGSTATGQSNEDGMDDSDSTSGLDSEVIRIRIRIRIQTKIPFDQRFGAVRNFLPNKNTINFLKLFFTKKHLQCAIVCSLRGSCPKGRERGNSSARSM